MSTQQSVSQGELRALPVGGQARERRTGTFTRMEVSCTAGPLRGAPCVAKVL